MSEVRVQIPTSEGSAFANPSVTYKGYSTITTIEYERLIRSLKAVTDHLPNWNVSETIEVKNTLR